MKREEILRIIERNKEKLKIKEYRRIKISNRFTWLVVFEDSERYYISDMEFVIDLLKRLLEEK